MEKASNMRSWTQGPGLGWSLQPSHDVLQRSTRRFPTIFFVFFDTQGGYTSASEVVFTAIYTYEAMVKMVSRGLAINDFTYFRDAWNWLDFSVIMLSYLTIAVDLGNFSAVKTFRVFRALKSVAVIPGLKTIVNAIIYSIKQLRDVIILTVFCLAVFGLLGLQFYMGVLSNVCIVDYDGRGSERSNVSWHDWVRSEEAWHIHQDTGKLIICGNSTGAGKCPEGTTCLQGFGPNPDYGYTNFDNFFYAYLCAFRLMTQDYWENLYQMTLRAVGPVHIIFFMINIFLGSFYLINLILAIVAMSYDELQRIAEEEAAKELEEMEAIKRAEERVLAEAEAAAQEAVAAAAAEAAMASTAENVSPNAELKSGKEEEEEEEKGLSAKSTARLASGSGGVEGGGHDNPAFEGGSISDDDPASNGGNDPRTQSATTQDICVLTDLVERVSASEVSGSGNGNGSGWPSSDDYDDEDLDDDEKLKRLLKERSVYILKVLCVWDCSKLWLRISELFSVVVFDAFTELFVTLCVLVNVVFMALDHYTLEHDGMSPFMVQMLKSGNYFFTAVFAVESFVKLAAMSPMFFFKDKWNVFDFVIVVMSLVELMFENVKGLSMLRSFRLLRVFKLAKSWKSLNDILQIMANSLGALSYLTFVLLIIIFIFAVMGNQLFKENYVNKVCNSKWLCVMPRWNFITFFNR